MTQQELEKWFQGCINYYNTHTNKKKIPIAGKTGFSFIKYNQKENKIDRRPLNEIDLNHFQGLTKKIKN